MAWAQRSDDVEFAVARSQRNVHRSWAFAQAERCAGCTRLITGEGVTVNRERYCSLDCVREARQAKDVPGHYLG